jgi:hypothetical protein
MNWIWSFLPVTNLLLSAFNYKHDYGWQKRRNFYSDECKRGTFVECIMEDGTLSDFSIISIQILVVILQATLAINFHRSGLVVSLFAEFFGRKKDDYKSCELEITKKLF